jgi:hypothetical protein
MSTWRKKALELFPDLRNEIQRGDATFYTVLFELLDRCYQAHQEGNVEELKKIYGYAEWCYRQKAKDLWNSAAVAFYEYLGNHVETRDEMQKWVKPDIFEDVAGLLENRMGEKEFARLKTQYYGNQS